MSTNATNLILKKAWYASMGRTGAARSEPARLRNPHQVYAGRCRARAALRDTRGRFAAAPPADRV